MIRRWAALAIGGCAAGAAVLGRGSVAGGAAWLVALAVACTGYGIALERVTRQRVPAVLTLAAGLAILLPVSLVLARLGWLGEGVELAAVVAGIAAAGLPRVPRADAEPRSGPGAGAWLIGAGAGLFAIAIAAIRRDAPIDGDNPVFLIKRLWDLGALPGGPRAGMALVGDAYATWASGAGAAGLFAGLCTALAICLVVEQLPAGERWHRLVLVLVVLAAVLRPGRGTAWPAVAFHLSAIFALRGPLAERRVAWHTILAAIALGLVRGEYWLLATPYAFAGLAALRPAWSRPQVAIGVAAWLCAATAIVAAMVGHAGLAVAKALAILAGLPVAALVLRMLGGVPWRSQLGALCAAVASYQLAIVAAAMPPAMHSTDAVFATWFVVAVAGALALVRDEAAPSPAWPRAAAVALATSLFGLTLLGLSMFSVGERRAMAGQLGAVAIAWGDRAAFGTGRAADAVHAAQLRIPPGDAIGFMGHSAARLEFARNPIRALVIDSDDPPAGAALRGLAWLIVEDLVVPRAYQDWTGAAIRTPLWIEGSGRVELRDAGLGVRVYRVTDPAPR